MPPVKNLMQDVFSTTYVEQPVVSNYTYPQEPKRQDTMSNIEALGYSFNTGFNMLQKHLLDRQAATREAPQATREQIMKVIASEQDQFLYSGLVNSVDDFKTLADVAARRQYLVNLQNAQQQVHDNFGTVGSLIAGIPMTLLDVDTIPLALTTGGLGIANKALSITSKAAKVAQASLVGAGIGAESTYFYEQTTGVKYKDSVTDSFLIGAALGGTLGYVFDHTKTPGNTTVNTLDNTEVKNSRELKQQAITEVQDNINRLDKAIEIKRNIDNTIKQHETALNTSLEKDTTKLQPVLKKVAETLQTKIDDAQKAVDDIKTNTTNRTSIVDVLKGEISDITKQIKELSKKETITLNKQTAAGSIQTKIEELLVKKTDIESKIKNINLVSMGKSSLIKNQIIKNNETLTKQLDEVNKEINKLNKQASKVSTVVDISKEEKALLTNLNQELQTKQNKLLKENTAITNNKAKIKELEADLKKQTNTKKAFDKGWHKTKIPLSADTKLLQEKIAKARDYTKILQQKDLLTVEETKMLNGDFGLINLKDKYVNRIDALNMELNEMSSIIEKADLEKLPIYNELPSMIKKLLISPIEKLKNSDNRYVAGLASLLHNGTLSAGKAITYTAENVRKELDMLLNQEVHNKIRENYYEAIKNNRFKGNLEEFSVKVSQEVYNTIGLMQKQAYEGIEAGLSHKEFAKRYEENLLSMQRKYSDVGNIEINRSIDSMLDYYEKIWERGHSLNMIGFQNTLKKGYSPRFYNSEVIAKNPTQAIEDLYNAQMRFASRANRNITDAVKNEFRAKAQNAVKETLEGRDVIKSITDPFETLSGINEQSLTSLETGRVKNRKIEVFDDEIQHLLDHDAISISGAYGLGLHGRIALKERLGVETSKEFEDLLNTVNATPEEKDYFRVITDTILARREITKNPFDPVARTVKGISSVSSLLHAGAFSVAQLTELTALTKEFGFNKTIKYFMEDLGNVYDLYTKGTISDKNQMKLIGSYGESMFHYKAGRLEAEGMIDSAGRLQQFLDKANHKLSLLSGMAPLTDMMKMMTSSMTTDFIARASVSKLSPTDYKRLLDMGLDYKDLEEIKRVLQVDKDGNIQNMDRTTWGEVDRKLTFAGLTTIDRTILHPSGATLPMFMTNYEGGAIVPRLLMKFMRFPVESYERLLLRGMQQMDAKQIMSLGANIGMWYTILQMKDALKDPDKQQYSGVDGQEKLYRDTMLSTTIVSAPIMLADRVYAAATGKTLTGYEASLSAPTSDIMKLRDGKINLSLPFYTLKMDIGKAASNILNNNSYLDELWTDSNDYQSAVPNYSTILNNPNNKPLETVESGFNFGLDFNKPEDIAGVALATAGALLLRRPVAKFMAKSNPTLYNKITGASQELPMMAHSNPELLAKIRANAPYDPTKPAMFVGQKAKLQPDTIQRLSVAKSLEGQKTPNESIWKQTGWFKAPDGEWRFEIPLDEEKIKTYSELTAPRTVEGTKEVKTEINNRYTVLKNNLNVLKDPKIQTLYNKYLPYIKQTEKELGYKLGAFKNYDELDNFLTRLEHNVGDKKRYNKGFGTLYNFINWNMKVGNSTETYKTVLEPITYQEYFTQFPLKEVIDPNHSLFKAYPSLEDIFVELSYLGNDTYGIWKRRYSTIELNISKPDSFKSTLQHELQHAIQDIEGFAQGGSPEIFTQEKFDKYFGKVENVSKDGLPDTLIRIAKNPKKFKETVTNLQTLIDDAEEQAVREITKQHPNAPINELSEKIIDRQYELLMKTDYPKLLDDLNNKYGSLFSNYEAYRRLYGETESRLTQNRADSGNFKEFPLNMLDVPIDELIILKGNK